MPDLLLELLSEEIPARFQERASEDLKRLVTARFAEEEVGFESAEAYATSRRVVLSVRGLPERQADRPVEIKGPRVGAPEKAIEGFLKSRGLTSIDRCQRRSDAKGEFYVHVDVARGMPTSKLIHGIVESVLADFPWPKSMRWGDQAVRWVRPLQRILCLFDGKAVPIAFGNRAAADLTEGHRHMARGPFAVTGFDDYRAKLAAHKVVLDPAERRGIIVERARALAAAEGLALVEDEDLAAENAGLVEWPVVHLGAFDASFLEVPPEVLTSAMKAHQKYFSVRTPDGKLANRFVMVANMENPDGGRAVLAGNQRVLRARLADARFFWDQDRKRKLADRVGELAGIVFHAKLGTVGDKVGRIEHLAVELAQYVPGCDAGQARRAAHLAKADLTSGMVGEFPELQGVMGRYYARHDGEAEAVAEAIAEHYAPLGPGDRCPTAPVSVAVALADKLDTLAGFFAAGEKPTGSKDPFALRRAALGAIRLILENGLRVGLGDAIAAAASLYGPGIAPKPEATARELLAFFADRLKVHLRGEGLRHDTIDAVFAKGDDDLVRLVARARALQAFLAGADGTNLLAAYKRAANIVRIETKRDGRAQDGAADAGKFVQAEENVLNESLSRVAAGTAGLIEREAFQDAMAAMAELRAPVDAFFDRVTVNAEDPHLRSNRLRLLARIQATMDRVADFTRIEG